MHGLLRLLILLSMLFLENVLADNIHNGIEIDKNTKVTQDVQEKYFTFPLPSGLTSTNLPVYRIMLHVDQQNTSFTGPGIILSLSQSKPVRLKDFNTSLPDYFDRDGYFLAKPNLQLVLDTRNGFDKNKHWFLSVILPPYTSINYTIQIDKMSRNDCPLDCHGKNGHCIELMDHSFKCECQNQYDSSDCSQDVTQLKPGKEENLLVKSAYKYLMIDGSKISNVKLYFNYQDPADLGRQILLLLLPKGEGSASLPTLLNYQNMTLLSKNMQQNLATQGQVLMLGIILSPLDIQKQAIKIEIKLEEKDESNRQSQEHPLVQTLRKNESIWWIVTVVITGSSGALILLLIISFLLKYKEYFFRRYYKPEPNNEQNQSEVQDILDKNNVLVNV